MLELEKKYTPIYNLFINKTSFKDIPNSYRGFISCNNKPIYNPKILFIGINPGQGAFLEKNSNKNIENLKFPIKTFSINSVKQLDWLKCSNSRIGKRWFIRNGEVNNSFVRNMVDFLFEYYQIEDGKDENYYLQFEQKINSEIFYWNINPIATKNVDGLKEINKFIASKNISFNNELLDSHIKVTNFFRQRTIDLILELNPEKIVCLGLQSFKELTFKVPNNNENHTKLKLRVNSEKEFEIFYFSRKGNWNNSIKEIGKLLRKTKKD